MEQKRYRGGNPAWVKGIQSPNPGGRPKAAIDIQALARDKCPDAIKALFDALSDPRTRVSAAVALLDRGYGRPSQTHTLNHNIPVAATADAALLAIATAGGGGSVISEDGEAEPGDMVH